MPEHKSSNQKYLICQVKRPGIKLIFFCVAWNLHPHLTAVMLIENYTRKLWLAEFFQNKQTFLRKIFFKNNLLSPHLETGIDHQINVLNNLNFEKIGTKSCLLISMIY